jgi:dihydroxy-acid dehydratase
MSEDVRGGRMTQEEFTAAESCMHRSKGHCMTMGTASTMASMVEALGVRLPGNAAIPAVDARRYRQAQLTGRRIVEMVEEEMALSKILTRAAFENAIRVNAAIGGSTNAVIHLLAIAGRVGVPLQLSDWDKIGSSCRAWSTCSPPASSHGRFSITQAGARRDARDQARARWPRAHRERQDAG